MEFVLFGSSGAGDVTFRPAPGSRKVQAGRKRPLPGGVAFRAGAVAMREFSDSGGDASRRAYDYGSKRSGPGNGCGSMSSAGAGYSGCSAWAASWTGAAAWEALSLLRVRIWMVSTMTSVV